MASQTYKLLPFAAQTQSLEMSVSFDVAPEQVEFRFKLTGDPVDIRKIAWPKAIGSPGRRDGLWQTTVFELFLSEPGDASYLEFNFSPSGEWNAYRFSSERSGMQEIAAIRKNPVHKMRRTAADVVVEGSIDRAALGWSGDIELSATSILDFGTHKEYWAITHKGDKPDFHLRSSFIGRIG